MPLSMTEILEQFLSERLDRENFYSVLGKAINVDSDKRICDLESIEGDANRAGINLQAVESETKGVVLIPKEGSFIIATFTDKRTGFVSLTSEIEKIHFEANDEDLKIILNDLIKEIKNAIINTPSGPGTVAPPTITLLDAIDARINKLFF